MEIFLFFCFIFQFMFCQICNFCMHGCNGAEFSAIEIHTCPSRCHQVTINRTIKRGFKTPRRTLFWCILIKIKIKLSCQCFVTCFHIPAKIPANPLRLFNREFIWKIGKRGYSFVSSNLFYLCNWSALSLALSCLFFFPSYLAFNRLALPESSSSKGSLSTNNKRVSSSFLSLICLSFFSFLSLSFSFFSY